MSDDETRREDARQEAFIEKAIKRGEITYCEHCGDFNWVKWMEVYDSGEMILLCRSCARDHEAKY